MTIDEIQNEIAADFKKHGNWFEKRKYLIQIGKSASPCARARASGDNLIRGCQVSTWFYSESKDGKMFYEIDSDSGIVKGIAVLLARIFSGQIPQDIILSDLKFVADAGLEEDFSPVRANSVLKIVGRIKETAAASLR